MSLRDIDSRTAAIAVGIGEGGKATCSGFLDRARSANMPSEVGAVEAP